MITHMIDDQDMILRTFSWLSVVLLMHTASMLYTHESVIFAAVSKQSDSQMFPHACSTCILNCSVFVACDYDAVVLHVAEQSSPRATLCKSMRHGEMKYRKTKQNQCNMRKVSWLWLKAAQAIPQITAKSSLIFADGHLEGISKDF